MAITILIVICVLLLITVAIFWVELAQHECELQLKDVFYVAGDKVFYDSSRVIVTEDPDRLGFYKFEPVNREKI